MKNSSIAMLETNGLVSSLVGLEAMLKLNEITFVKSEVITNGQVTVFVSGKLTDLNRAILAGEIAANSVGKVISSTILDNPSQTILDIIFDKKGTAPKQQNKKKKNVKNNNVETLFDDIFDDAILEESNKISNTNEPILHESEAEKIELQTVGEVEEISEEKVFEPLIVEEVETITENEIEQNDEEFLREQVASELSHIERLRAEARLEIERENSNQTKTDENFKNDLTIESSKKEISFDKSSNAKLNKSNEFESEIEKMNVPQLRKLARENPDFPIKGREISKANRKELLSYFHQIKND